jgi:hypothetical protein
MISTSLYGFVTINFKIDNTSKRNPGVQTVYGFRRCHNATVKKRHKPILKRLTVKPATLSETPG